MQRSPPPSRSAFNSGEKLLPEATKALHWIATDGIADLQQFGHWFEAHEGDFETWASAMVAVAKPTLDEIKQDLNLITAALDIFEGHWGDAWHHVMAAATDASDKVKDTASAMEHVLGDLGGVVESAGAGAWDHFESAATHAASEVERAVGKLPHEMVDALESLAGVLGSEADQAWMAFVSSIEHGAHVAVKDVEHLPSDIVAALGDVDSLLISAGEHVIGGLVSGIEHAAESTLKDALHKVTSLIPDWKGPADKDAVLLYPAGQSIIDGLGYGIMSRMPQLQSQLATVTSVIQGTAAAIPVGTVPTLPSQALSAVHGAVPVMSLPRSASLPAGGTSQAMGGDGSMMSAAVLDRLDRIEQQLATSNWHLAKAPAATGKEVAVASVRGYALAGQAYARQVRRSQRKNR
jgi:hypothetical protein